MPIIKKELELLPIGEIFKKELVIPEYQRPYKWKEETILKLLNDIKNNKNKNEYRIGTLILHKTIESEKEIYNIVDGQQRLVSISIILNILEKLNDKKESVENSVLDSYFNDISKNNIIRNYKYIKSYVPKDTDLLKFILNNCKMVIIVVNKLEEAFQLFDSQNSRGKPLEAFDLLKAYHLNEVSSYITNLTKKQIVNKWEKLINNNRLGELFNTLYRIKKWTVRDYANDNFYKNEINLFKGINKNKNYPYINSSIVNNYYDINNPIINGEYFFYMLEYYNDLYDTVEGRLKNASYINYPNSNRKGDILVKSLYKAALIAFINKFGIDSLNDNLNIKIYSYAYRIRLEKYAVSNHIINNSINNYFYYIYNFCYEPNDILKLGIMNQKVNITNERRKIGKIIYYIKNTLPIFYNNEEIK
ncbi:DUF262 domain-containing protein [Brachyspira intermedia]|uniref:DUF262 domain-containing protein n=1 Tax=Brachyspira intermedia TaxID=84377 RepID=UPI0030065311